VQEISNEHTVHFLNGEMQVFEKGIRAEVTIMSCVVMAIVFNFLLLILLVLKYFLNIETMLLFADFIL
jgi:hypothetical protein